MAVTATAYSSVSNTRPVLNKSPGGKMMKNNKLPGLNKRPGRKITEKLISVLGRKIKDNHIFFYFSM